MRVVPVNFDTTEIFAIKISVSNNMNEICYLYNRENMKTLKVDY